MSEIAYLISIGVIAVTILSALAIRYWALAVRAQTSAAGAQAQRETAEKAASALARIDESLADLRTRMAAVEKVLADVG